MRSWVLEVNFLSLALCTVSSILISTIWFGPLFGELWFEYSNFNRKKAEEIQGEAKNRKILIALMGTVITTLVYSIFIRSIPVINFTDLVLLDILITMGFLGPNMIASFIWKKNKLEYVLINLGYQFVNLLAQGFIILLVGDLDLFNSEVTTSLSEKIIIG